MTLEIVDPLSNFLVHLVSVDVKFSGAHIGGGIYFSANHNPSPGGSNVAIPQRSLVSEGEIHNTTELDYTLPDGGEPWDDYRDDIDNNGVLDVLKTGFDMSLHIGDPLSGGDFYDGPSVPLLIANDPSDLYGTVTITGYPSAANALDGMNGTLHQTTGTLAQGGYTQEIVSGNIGGYFTITGAEAVGGMSGGGNFLDFDVDGDGTTETYLVGSTTRIGTIDDTPVVLSTSFSPHYAKLAAAIEGLIGSAIRTADDFGRMTLLSAQTVGSSATTVTGQFFHEDIYGGVNNDTLSGGGGNDNIFGAAGDDILSGGDGDDQIDGGLGGDILTGGAGSDTFLSSGFGNGAVDIINDFESTSDTLELRGFFESLNDVIAATTENMDGSITIDLSQGTLPAASIGGTVQVLNTTIADLNNLNVSVVCFVSGTLIETVQGPKCVENIKPGDMVWTYDCGFQPVKWVGKQSFKAAELQERPNLLPILISAHALGKNVPETNLYISQQHRILVSGQISNHMFDTAEILLAAKKLVLFENIDISEDIKSLCYVHIMFDTHQIIRANGCLCESLLIGAETLKSISRNSLNEILEIFPDFCCTQIPMKPARTVISGKKADKFLWRHRKNKKSPHQPYKTGFH